jgi:alginate O-acetyltransferase complex protein AlgI
MAMRCLPKLSCERFARPQFIKMVFTSWSFAIFLLIVLAGLLVLPGRTAKQAFLLVASAFFYAYWNPKYLLLLAAPSLIDYVCALQIEKTEIPARRRTWLLISVLTNLGLLGYFKYANFFIDSASHLFRVTPPHLNVLLPVGISFYTFKTLSYTIDVYRRELPACRSLWKYAMFVTYFPELVAGPIVRASVFLPQMTRSLKPCWPRTVIGLQLILLGVTKKLGIADRLSPFVDHIFKSPGRFTPGTVILAVVAYSLQVYSDFSGYSDIAIGVSKIIGFDLPENFNMPFLATSITDFWRRWHITLSSWLRDYLYIPLGGNRRGKYRTYLNLIITMLLGGLWHGANWTYVVFGMLHGAALAVHKLWTEMRHPRAVPSSAGKLTGWFATYVFFCLTLVIFRSPNFSIASDVLRKVFWLDRGGIEWIYTPLLMLIPVIVLGHVIGVTAQRQLGQKQTYGLPPSWAQALYRSETKSRFAVRPHKWAGVYFLLPLQSRVGVMAFTFWIVLAFLFASVESRPFIYFQF